MGGYRKGSGRSKSGYFRGIYCGSTYELCWVIYSLDHGIGFQRFPGKIEKNGLVYYPDFLLADNTTIIETKGYESKDKVDSKTRLAEEAGYAVQVLYKEDLEPMFSYVTRAYGTKKFHELYDDYRPVYQLRCANCDSDFGRDTKPKSEQVFCSRKCAGSFRKRKNAGMAAPVISTKRPYAKVSKNQALEIFHRDDKSYQELADEYGISKGSVWLIKKKKTYKWIHSSP